MSVRRYRERFDPGAIGYPDVRFLTRARRKGLGRLRMQLGLPVAVTASMLARRALDGWMEEVVDEEAAAASRLAATELVTNAVQHSGLQLGDEVILRALAMPQLVRIEVEQPSSAAGARIVDRDDRRGPHGGGYGLRIVDEIAERWGVEPGPPGCVWFEIGGLTASGT